MIKIVLKISWCVTMIDLGLLVSFEFDKPTTWETRANLVFCETKFVL